MMPPALQASMQAMISFVKEGGDNIRFAVRRPHRLCAARDARTTKSPFLNS